MENFRIKKQSYKSRKFSFTFSAIIILIAFFIIFSEKISDIFYHTSNPIQKSLAFMGGEFSVLFGSFQEKSILVRENEKLKEEKQGLVAEISFLKEIEKENQKLREALDLDFGKSFELIFARVSGFIFLEDSFLIDKGKRDGISVGMPVINEKKVVVGKVFETYENFSKIMLITHKDGTSFDVEIQGREVMGIARGEGKLGLILDLVPRDKEIKEGDFVMTLGQVFPGGFPVGKIREIIKSDTDPFQRAQISLFFNPFALRNVFVITDYQK